jgi:hypothetical protein
MRKPPSNSARRPEGLKVKAGPQIRLVVKPKKFFFSFVHREGYHVSHGELTLLAHEIGDTKKGVKVAEF